MEKEKRKVLVISRHYPSFTQMQVIKRECGQNCLITWENQRFEDAEQVLRMINQGGYDEVALVAPKDVLATLFGKGLNPIHLSTMEISKEEKVEGDFKKRNGQWLRCTAQRIRHVEIKIAYY